MVMRGVGKLGKVGWLLANLCYWLDRQWWLYGPGGWQTSIIAWMERRGVCCERHKK